MPTMEPITSTPFPTLITSSPSSATSTTHRTVNIGTRKSLLARVQTDIVVAALKRSWPQNDYVVHAISTIGDKDQVTKLSEFGAKSLWTHELEAMLVQGEVDFIVHSLKDIPTQLAPALLIGAILARENPHDALVLHPRLPASTTLSSLPPFSLIGTSSVRRSAQLKRLHPHLSFASVRGNVGTRLSKLDAPDSPFSAIILAAAGLLRLNLGSRISAILRSSSANAEGEGWGHRRTGMQHAVGQGALGIEMREGDERVAALLKPLKCVRTTLACLAERSLMRTLEGGCSVPIGVETEWGASTKITTTTMTTTTAEAAANEVLQDPLSHQQNGDAHPTDAEPNDDPEQVSDMLTMRAIVVSVDGSEAAEAELRQRITTEHEADEFGWLLARALVVKGADRILQAITLNRAIIEDQGDA